MLMRIASIPYLTARKGLAMLNEPDFGRRLRTLRQERGLSQAKLAEDGLSSGYLSRLESGARLPTPKAISYLAERLGASPSAFEVPHLAEGAPVEDLVKAITAPDADSRAGGLLERVAHNQPEFPMQLRWLALWSLAELHAQRGAPDAQLAAAQELLRLAVESGVPELSVRSRVLMARLHRSFGDMKIANSYAYDAYETATNYELRTADVVRTLMVLISTEAEVSRLPDALKHVAELEVLSQGTSGTLRVEALWTAASVYVRQGSHATAAASLAEALELHTSHADLKLWLRLRFAATSLYLQMHPSRNTEAQQVLREVEPALELVATGRQHPHDPRPGAVPVRSDRRCERTLLGGRLGGRGSRLPRQGEVRGARQPHQDQVRTGRGQCARPREAGQGGA